MVFKYKSYLREHIGFKIQHVKDFYEMEDIQYLMNCLGYELIQIKHCYTVLNIVRCFEFLILWEASISCIWGQVHTFYNLLANASINCSLFNIWLPHMVRLFFWKFQVWPTLKIEILASDLNFVFHYFFYLFNSSGDVKILF